MKDSITKLIILILIGMVVGYRQFQEFSQDEKKSYSSYFQTKEVNKID